MRSLAHTQNEAVVYFDRKGANQTVFRPACLLGCLVLIMYVKSNPPYTLPPPLALTRSTKHPNANTDPFSAQTCPSCLTSSRE